jgi:hypothetical protein
MCLCVCVCVFCYIIWCGFGVKCSEKFSVYCVYLAGVTKLYRMIFSGWCESELLTADFCCGEISGDTNFKASLEGRNIPRNRCTSSDGIPLFSFSDNQLLKSIRKLFHNITLAYSCSFAAELPTLQCITTNYQHCSA